MEEQKPCCPNCRSENLYLIGGVFLSTEGKPYDGKPLVLDSVASFVQLGGSFTRELLFCKGCDQQCLLSAAKDAAKVSKEDVLWAGTDVGTTIPIVCPKCGNGTELVRNVAAAVEYSEEITIEGGKVEGSGGKSELTVKDEVITSYVCNMNECYGEVVLHKGDHRLTVED